MKRSSKLIAAGILAALAACAQQEADRMPAAEAVTLGVLDGAYDQASWEWVKNADTRMLLRHRHVAQCFLDPEPPMDVNEGGLRVTRGSRTIGAARYDVITAYEGQDFWEAVYLKSGSQRPALGVYAGGECQKEAEKILEAYETRGRR
jgi:hypothetical protein